jgi:hypothetical protein
MIPIILEWLHDKKLLNDDTICADAACYGNVDVLNWLYAHGYEISDINLEECWEVANESENESENEKLIKWLRDSDGKFQSLRTEKS